MSKKIVQTCNCEGLKALIGTCFLGVHKQHNVIYLYINLDGDGIIEFRCCPQCGMRLEIEEEKEKPQPAWEDLPNFPETGNLNIISKAVDNINKAINRIGRKLFNHPTGEKE